MSQDGRQLKRLREEIRRALEEIDELGGQVLEIVGIIEEALEPVGLRPVLVGGMAVYLWTANDAFLTNDIDLVTPTTPELDRTLKALGFEKNSGRHWHLPGSEVFIEAPSSALDTTAAVTPMVSPSGRDVPVLSRVDVLIERLDDFQGTGNHPAAEQAMTLLKSIPPEQAERLQARAKERHVDVALQGLRELAEELESGVRTEPDSAEWHEIARHLLRAQYHQGRR